MVSSPTTYNKNIFRQNESRQLSHYEGAVFAILVAVLPEAVVANYAKTSPKTSPKTIPIYDCYVCHIFRIGMDYRAECLNRSGRSPN